MRLHRFIGDFDLSQKNVNITDSELINQISRVLRLEAGDKFILSDGKSNEAIAQIIDLGKKTIAAEISKQYKNENETIKKVFLYCAILKRENFELVIQKATEAGIFEIIPLITERTVKTGLNMERLRKIIREAAEQSGRGLVPRLHQAMEFKMVMDHAKLNDKNILFDLSSTEKMTEATNVGIFIGPEGGFSTSELEFAKEHNFIIASLGKLTLRAETAAIIASYLAGH